MSRTTILLTVGCLLYLGCSPDSPETIVDETKSAEEKNTESLIVRLRNLPPDRYYDWHGNEHDQIRSLLKCRFTVTEAVCKEIDRAARRAPHQYIEMLYYCLGYVKDAESIPWLEEKLRRDDSSVIHEKWLRRWGTYPRGAAHSQLKWLEQPDRWAAFFREQAKRERDSERRLALLKALAGWFHDPQTIQFFLELEKATETEGETLLLTQLYLYQHKRPFDTARLSTAIAKVRSQLRRNEALIEYASELRHEAFLPWLISLLPEASKTDSDDDSPDLGIKADDVQFALEKITFRLDVVGRQGWQAWYEKHRSLGRETWLRQAAAEFEALAEKEPKKAHDFFEKAVYRWNDRAMLPYVQRWVKYRFLHSNLIGWINLSYHPFWRADLQPLAEQVIEGDHRRLERWAQDIARDLDFIKNDETWESQFDWYGV